MSHDRSFQPPPGRPGWVSPEEEELELLYLAWGWRKYRDTPMFSSGREGWIYFTPRRGAPTFLLPDRQITLRPGDFVLIDPSCPCGWDDAAGASSEVCTWVWRSAPRWKTLTPPIGGCLQWKLAEPVRQTVWQLHQATRQEVQNADENTHLALSALRVQLDLALLRGQSARTQPASDAQRLALARRWLEEHLSCPNPVESLCEYLQLSASTLHRLFRRTLGTDVRAYARDERVRRAQQLIETEGQSVKEAAYAVGYRFPNDLSRARRQAGNRAR